MRHAPLEEHVQQTKKADFGENGGDRRTYEIIDWKNEQIDGEIEHGR